MVKEKWSHVTRSERSGGVLALSKADLREPLHTDRNYGNRYIHTYLIMLIACIIAGTITPLYRSFGRNKREFTGYPKGLIWLFGP